jgi:hypothetical protein
VSFNDTNVKYKSNGYQEQTEGTLITCMELEVLIVVSINMTVLWDETSCSVCICTPLFRRNVLSAPSRTGQNTSAMQSMRLIPIVQYEKEP